MRNCSGKGEIGDGNLATEGASVACRERHFRMGFAAIEIWDSTASVRLRATCAIHAPSARAVMPAM